MSHKRVILSLIALAVAISVGFPAPAQDLRDMQFFAPAELDTYSGPREAKEGFFFTFDYLIWSISAPEVVPIGFPSESGREVWLGPNPEDVITQNNTHDTGVFGAEFVSGQRFQGGYVYGHQGLLFSAWRLNSQTQDVRTGSMDMVFNDEEAGGDLDLQHLVGYVDEAQTVLRPLPVTFDSTTIRNRVNTWGVELSYLLRSNQCHSGGYFETFLGARYLEFNDQFFLNAFGELVAVTIADGVATEVPQGDTTTAIYKGTLANSFWRQDAYNHIVGPQVGARWFNHYGRWMLSTEGRFFAGFNSQNLHQQGRIGTELNSSSGALIDPENHVPVAFRSSGFEHVDHENEWSPGIELQANLEWQWTRNISLGAGWSGMWLDGIARASNLINYEFGTSSLMGIQTENNRQDVFIHGATFRINVNR